MDTKIPKFRRCVIQNFPFIEQDFDALTDYALLSKVVEYLNKVIDQTNLNSEQVADLSTAFNQLRDYVDHYFDSSDFAEKVDEGLERMAESGTLGELINQVLFQSKMSAYKPLSLDLDLEYSDKGSVQAFCHTVDGKFVTVEIGANDTSNVIREYNSEGTMLRSATITCYHPNSICFDGTDLYIANAYQTVGGVTSDINVVTKVNYSTFETTDINLTHPVKVIGYYDGKFYCLTDAYSTLKIYNSDFSNLIATETIANFGDLYQGIAINEHHIIMSQSHHWIVFFNHDLTVDRVINVRNFDYLTAGELQDVDYYNGLLYINMGRTLGGTRVYWYIGSCNYMISNPDNEMLNSRNNPYSNKTIYVDGDNTSIKQLGTQDYPFAEIEQGIFAIFNPYILGLTIGVNEGTYDKVHLKEIGKPITIIGRETKTNTLIKGFNIEHCTDVHLSNFSVSEVYNAENANYGLYAQYSTIFIDNVKFNIDNSIYLNYGTLHEGYTVGVTDSNAMDIKNCTYTNLDNDLKNFTKHPSVIYNRKAILFESSEGKNVTETFNFAPYNISNFKALKFRVAVTSAATSTTWYKTFITSVNATEKIDLLLKDNGQSIFWWSVLTLYFSTANNRMSGSSQYTTTTSGESVASANQPVIKVLSIEEV